MKQLFDRLNVVHSVAAPHAHQTVGSVERANRDIRQYMRLYETGSDWDLHLRPMMHALNAAFCVPIGRSPAELMFGRQFLFPQDFQLMAQEEALLNVPEWELEWDKGLKDAAQKDIAFKSKMKEAFESQAGKGSDKRVIVVGDKVLYDPEDRSPGWKNARQWQGPFEVLASEREGQRVTIVFDGKHVTRGAEYFKIFRESAEGSEDQPNTDTTSVAAGQIRQGAIVQPITPEIQREAGGEPGADSPSRVAKSEVEVVATQEVSTPTSEEEEPDQGELDWLMKTPSADAELALEPELLAVSPEKKKFRKVEMAATKEADVILDYEVEDVLAVRDMNGERHYRVCWHRFSAEYNSWEPEGCLSGTTIEEARLKWPKKVSPKQIKYKLDAMEIEAVTNIQHVGGRGRALRRRVFYVRLRNDNWSADLEVSVGSNFFPKEALNVKEIWESEELLMQARSVLADT